MGIQSSPRTIQSQGQDRKEKKTILGQLRDESQRLGWHHNALSSRQISTVSAWIGHSTAPP